MFVMLSQELFNAVEHKLCWLSLQIESFLITSSSISTVCCIYFITLGLIAFEASQQRFFFSFFFFNLIGIFYLTALEVRSSKSRYHVSYYSGKKQKLKLNSNVLITWYMQILDIQKNTDIPVLGRTAKLRQLQ